MELDAATIALLAALSAFAYKATSFVKMARATDWSGLLTQLVAWGAGVAAPYLASGADVNASLQDVSGAGKVLIGLLVGSVGSIVNDLRSAIDNTDTAVEPPL